MATIFLALGSNLDNPQQHIINAIDELAQLPHCSLLKASHLYQNPSLLSGQADFINAVVHLTTNLTPLELLAQCKTIEQEHHRVHYYHWGPRTLDIDILLYDNLDFNHEKLTIPHPYLCERNFVIAPLFEIAPDLILPDGISLASIHHKLNFKDLVCIKLS